MKMLKNMENSLEKIAPYIIKIIKKEDAINWIENFEKNYKTKIDMSEISHNFKYIIIVALGYNLDKPDYEKGEMTISPYYYFSNKYYLEIENLIQRLKLEGHDVEKLKNTHLKSLANMAGIGYYGKNSVIHNDRFGSKMVLFAFGTDIKPGDIDDLNYDISDCGDCRICIENCPNKALKEFLLIREKCIRNYTIEGNYIPEKMRNSLGTRLIGCDICQEVCPKNKDINNNLPEMILEDRNLILPEIYMKNWEKGLKPYINKLSEFIGKNYARTNRVLTQSIITSGNTNRYDLIDVLTKLENHPDKDVREYSKWAKIKIIEERNKRNEYKYCKKTI